MMELVKLSATVDNDSKYDEQFKKISDEINALKAKLEVNQSNQAAKNNTTARLNEIFETLEQYRNKPMEYNDITIRQLLDCVKVISEEKILVIFKGGMEMEASL
jgi:site-specific DNA recombinase